VKDKCKAKKRGSSILNSLYEYGCKHAQSFMIDDQKKKRKERKFTEYTLSHNNYSILPHPRQRQTRTSEVFINIENSHSNNDHISNISRYNNNDDKNGSISTYDTSKSVHNNKNNSNNSNDFLLKRKRSEESPNSNKDSAIYIEKVPACTDTKIKISASTNPVPGSSAQVIVQPQIAINKLPSLETQGIYMYIYTYIYI
jgi:hypothetical protein